MWHATWQETCSTISICALTTKQCKKKKCCCQHDNAHHVSPSHYSATCRHWEGPLNACLAAFCCVLYCTAACASLLRPSPVALQLRINHLSWTRLTCGMGLLPACIPIIPHLSSTKLTVTGSPWVMALQFELLCGGMGVALQKLDPFIHWVYNSFHMGTLLVLDVLSCPASNTQSIPVLQLLPSWRTLMLFRGYAHTSCLPSHAPSSHLLLLLTF